MKYSLHLGENVADLQKALELMLSVPHRAIDNKFIASIEGYRGTYVFKCNCRQVFLMQGINENNRIIICDFSIGNIHKLGRLLSHEWWTVTDNEKKPKDRYLFLFKSRILVCKVRRISEDRSVFILKDIIKVFQQNAHEYISAFPISNFKFP